MDFNDFFAFSDRFSEAKSDKHRLKNGIEDGMPKFNHPLAHKMPPWRVLARHGACGAQLTSAARVRRRR